MNCDWSLLAYINLLIVYYNKFLYLGILGFKSFNTKMLKHIQYNININVIVFISFFLYIQVLIILMLFSEKLVGEKNEIIFEPVFTMCANWLNLLANLCSRAQT